MNILGLKLCAIDARGMCALHGAYKRGATRRASAARRVAQVRSARRTQLICVLTVQSASLILIFYISGIKTVIQYVIHNRDCSLFVQYSIFMCHPLS